LFHYSRRISKNCSKDINIQCLLIFIVPCQFKNSSRDSIRVVPKTLTYYCFSFFVPFAAINFSTTLQELFYDYLRVVRKILTCCFS
jgi:hypothetical protein